MKSLLIALIFLIGCVLKPAPRWPGDKKSEFLHVCWYDGPSTSFAPAWLCQSDQQPEVIEWDSLPLRVTSDDRTSLSTILAIGVWNEWLGFEAFVYEPLGMDPDVVVLYGGSVPPGGSNAAALTMFEKRRSDGKQHSLVALFDAGVEQDRAYIHELGHVLGLAHDDNNRRSIMFPGLRGMFAPELEMQDYSALRHRYHFRRKTLK